MREWQLVLECESHGSVLACEGVAVSREGSCRCLTDSHFSATYCEHWNPNRECGRHCEHWNTNRLMCATLIFQYSNTILMLYESSKGATFDGRVDC